MTNGKVRLAMPRRCSLQTIFAAVAVLVAAGPVHAQPPADGASGDDLGGLLEGLDLDPDTSPAEEPTGEPAPSSTPEPRPAEEPAVPLVQAFVSMRSARDLLRQGQTGDQTQHAQQRAVRLLDAMIRSAEDDQSSGASATQQPENQQPAEAQQSAAREGAEQPSESPAEQQPQGEESEAGAAQTTAAGTGAGDPAAEIAAGRGDPQSLDADGEGVWGHLPQRTRGLLRSEVPTEYLPRYAEQISDYFRALAEIPADE